MSATIKSIDGAKISAYSDVNGRKLELGIDSDNKVTTIGGRELASSSGPTLTSSDGSIAVDGGDLVFTNKSLETAESSYLPQVARTTYSEFSDIPAGTEIVFSGQREQPYGTEGDFYVLSDVFITASTLDMTFTVYKDGELLGTCRPTTLYKLRLPAYKVSPDVNYEIKLVADNTYMLRGKYLDDHLGVPTVKENVYQKTLSEGFGVKISDNVISVDKNTVQVLLTNGDGIQIDGESNTISVDYGRVQQKLVAGDNISITGNVISSTGGGGEGSDSLLVEVDDSYDYETVSALMLAGKVPFISEVIPNTTNTVRLVATFINRDLVDSESEYAGNRLVFSAAVVEDSTVRVYYRRCNQKMYGGWSSLQQIALPFPPSATGVFTLKYTKHPAVAYGDYSFIDDSVKPYDVIEAED